MLFLNIIMKILLCLDIRKFYNVLNIPTPKSNCYLVILALTLKKNLLVTKLAHNLYIQSYKLMTNSVCKRNSVLIVYQMLLKKTVVCLLFLKRDVATCSVLRLLFSTKATVLLKVVLVQVRSVKRNVFLSANLKHTASITLFPLFQTSIVCRVASFESLKQYVIVEPDNNILLYYFRLLLQTVRKPNTIVKRFGQRIT